MRKLMISLAVTTAALVAVPAAAQYQDYGRYDQRYNQGQTQNIQDRIQRLNQRIQRASQRGTITRHESQRLYNELRRIDYLYNRYRQNGISQRESYDLQNRLQNLQQQVREDRRDGRRYDDRDGRYNDGYRY